MKPKLLLLVILLIIGGCSGEKRNQFNESQKSEKREIELLPISDEITRAFDLLILENNLIISDPDQEFHFKIFDLESQNLIGKFGKIGDGPCEVQFPSSIQRLSGEKNKVGINNRNSFSYLEFRFGKTRGSLQDSCFLLNGKFDFNYQKFVKISQDRIVGTGLFQSRFAISRIKDNKILGLKGKYPFEKELVGFQYETLAMAFQGDLLVHPSNSWVVSTSRKSFNFDILKFDENGELNQITEKHYWPPSFEGETGDFVQARMKEDNKSGCLSTTVSENFIYILFSGKTAEEKGNESNKIHVYDWDGILQKTIDVNSPLNLISVSENDEFLIGYLDDGKSNIFKIDLN
ncbi:TolB-like 6-bladed beta-propeller domain-containing protein [Aquiflexum gelatinilyticum]|uniref:TolB-like 6-bladed beta-propeller domain-containing protein n=1 Tax=Aquiflexum gelatinilyticum TaxID=2961943 RepID=A0A9X2P2U1_9BACT|nr:TolB-like 6-bladed beta-propeller domain-containing protein [Aquiflexum gelatinilyticum]MCR9015024.1 TolB-like 6-bladed beta-propeller domain-containing protein [Aquiflexum gelatinilyticum]